MEKLWKNYNLSIILFILFLSSWVGQGVFQWQEFVQNQQEHGQEVVVSDFIPQFGTSTLENWQSEFLQLFTMVVLTSFLIHKGSAESRDSQDKMQADITKILNLIDKTKTSKRSAKA